jgi:hypothetical protein
MALNVPATPLSSRLLRARTTPTEALHNFPNSVVWGEVFRASLAFANVEFLRGYAGCPVPAGLGLAIDLALDAGGGRLGLDALAARVASATDLDQRLCRRAILRLGWERRLVVDVSGPPVGPHTLVSSTAS